MTPDRPTVPSEPRAGGYHDVAPAIAAAHLTTLRLVDVREPDEFVGPLGHVPGAELVPLGTLPSAAPTLEPDAPVLLICRSGARSARAATMLATLGFRHVYNLAGGMLAWEAAGLTVSRDAGLPGVR